MSRDVASLERWFRDAGRVLLGYSGGVDSALLAVVGARALGPAFLAAIGRSPSYPAVQWQAAVELARERGIPLVEIATRELDDPEYSRNGTSRCFFCKRELWARLGEVARERGFELMIDGTNADDPADHRPGLAAGVAAGIRSPLAELGWTKLDVRRAARELGLPGWNAPASPCLASRIRYGLPVTPERLAQVEAAERLLRARGFHGDLRVRHHGVLARVEVDPALLDELEGAWPELEPELAALGFDRVERDPAGYRRGSLLGR
jgi:uncharacterized protein